MDSDLVKRLRNCREGEWTPILTEAADRIAELESALVKIALNADSSDPWERVEIEHAAVKALGRPAIELDRAAFQSTGDT